MADLSRRRFCEVAGILAAALAGLPGCGRKKDPPAMEEPPPESGDAGPDLPSLGGAPDTPAGRTIAAFCDAVVPGSHRDPTGAPGALDAGAPAWFFDASLLPAQGLVDPLVLLLDGVSRDTVGKTFANANTSERERVVAAGLGTAPQLGLAVQLARLAFLSSPVAAEWLGYPGANEGYVGDPDLSFRRPLARGITEDGNLP